MHAPTTASPPSTAPRLRPPRHRVSPRAIRYWAVRALAGWLVVAVAEVAWTLLAGHRGLDVAILGATVGLAAAHATLMPRWRYRVHRWDVREGTVYTQAG